MRTNHDREHPLYVVGGRRLDKAFLSTLNVAPEMRVLLYQNRDESFSADHLMNSSASSEDARSAETLAPLIDAVRRGKQEMSMPIRWSSNRADEEIFHAIPLRGVGGDRPLLGILLVGQSRRTYVGLREEFGTQPCSPEPQESCSPSSSVAGQLPASRVPLNNSRAQRKT